MNKDTLMSVLQTEVLPKLHEWLMITKTYAGDLIDRATTYYIISDAVWIWAWFLLSIVASIFGYFVYKQRHNFGTYDDTTVVSLSIVWGVIGIASLIIIGVNLANLIQSVYLPELRIYSDLIKPNP